jgi:hypothetical protein
MAKNIRPQPATRRRSVTVTRDLALFVEVVPGVWQPQEMAVAERWKQQMRRRNSKER